MQGNFKNVREQLCSDSRAFQGRYSTRRNEEKLANVFGSFEKHLEEFNAEIFRMNRIGCERLNRFIMIFETLIIIQLLENKCMKFFKHCKNHCQII